MRPKRISTKVNRNWPLPSQHRPFLDRPPRRPSHIIHRCQQKVSKCTHLSRGHFLTPTTHNRQQTTHQPDLRIRCLRKRINKSAGFTVLSRNNLTLRLRFGCGSSAVRLRFGCGSVAVRLRFGCGSVAVRLRSTDKNRKRPL